MLSATLMLTPTQILLAVCRGLELSKLAAALRGGGRWDFGDFNAHAQEFSSQITCEVTL